MKIYFITANFAVSISEFCVLQVNQLLLHILSPCPPSIPPGHSWESVSGSLKGCTVLQNHRVCDFASLSLCPPSLSYFQLRALLRLVCSEQLGKAIVNLEKLNGVTPLIAVKATWSQPNGSTYAVNTLLSILVLSRMCENEVAEEMPSYNQCQISRFYSRYVTTD